jgi:Ca2+ transporting ATPase
LFKIATCVNGTALLRPEEKGSATEIAILKYLEKVGVDYEFYRKNYEAKMKFPFSSARKRMSVIVKYKG